MPVNSSSGLPPRIYVPIVTLIAAVFLCTMAYLVADGFGVTGSVFGKAAPSGAGGSTERQGSQDSVEGGPPAPVMAQLQTLRARIASHPGDDVALTQLADMYLAANKFEEAIPFYRRALRANPRNVAAQTGLAQAREALRE
ncbi:MAG TPA: tetratricopeptide repeat protein [Candidatus Dormibacteraeota bacterium]|nr:tetratricopeptide repeat protein [Candidatus Dormibacteraeota bacterium]